MNAEFTGKVALVTGAGSGIGRLSAEKLAELGAAVGVLDINPDAAETVAAGIRERGGRARAIVCDVRRPADFETAAAQLETEFGGIDFAVNAAGGNGQRILHAPGPFHELPFEVIDWTVAVNFRGPMYCARAVMPAMIRRGGGVIVLIASVDALNGAPDPTYSASKAGVIGMAKSLAVCGAPHKIRACCVTPGPVLTRPEMARMATRLGRAAEPIEIVDLILYLCSERAAFVTGSNFVIDGGRSCGSM